MPVCYSLPHQRSTTRNLSERTCSLPAYLRLPQAKNLSQGLDFVRSAKDLRTYSKCACRYKLSQELPPERTYSLPTCHFLCDESVQGLGAVSPDRVDQGLEDVAEVVENLVRSIEQLAKRSIPAKVWPLQNETRVDSVYQIF